MSKVDDDFIDKRRTRDDPELQAGGHLKGKPDDGTKITLWDRLDHCTFAWFTLPMATGGISLLLSVQPNTFNGLITIGKIVYIFDLVLFLLITSAILTRLVRNPQRIKKLLRNNTEALFIPTFFICIPTVIGGMQQYGVPSTGPWLIVTVRVLFWIYCALAFLVAVVQYFFLFTASRLTIQSMTPAWLLPIFPIMLGGTFASLIAGDQPPSQAVPILVAGATFQGLGFWTAILMYSVFIARLMDSGLPGPNLRPGMFISVGPPAFTALALIGMSHSIPPDYGYFAAHPTAIEALQQLALAFSIFIWSLGFWFFCISLLSCLMAVSQMCFHLVWWAFVFPNTGFVLALIAIGRDLESSTIGWIGSALSIVLVAMYIFVFVMHVRAVVNRHILWPGKDEDKDE